MPHPQLNSVLFSLLLLISSSSSALDFNWFGWFGDKEPQRVQIASPFIDLRTGPGKGYPLFYVAERDTWIEFLKRKTTWYKVRTDNGKTGWVHEEQLAQTLKLDDEEIDFGAITQADYEKRKWEIGISAGAFGGADVISGYAAYNATKNIAAEVSVSQSVAAASDTNLYDFTLIHQTFPQWRVSPYFALGGGHIKVDAKSTVAERTTDINEADKSDQGLHVGGGFRIYLTRRFIVRLDYRNYTILTSNDDDRRVEQWKLGVGAFF